MKTTRILILMIISLLVINLTSAATITDIDFGAHNSGEVVSSTLVVTNDDSIAHNYTLTTNDLVKQQANERITMTVKQPVHKILVDLGDGDKEVVIDQKPNTPNVKTSVNETISKGNITLNITSFTLQPNQNITVTVNVSIPDHQPKGDYKGIINLTEDGLEVAHSTLLLRVNNNKPVFTTTPPTTAIVNDLYMYDAAAQDDDNDTLTFSGVFLPPGMTIDNAGHVRWVPTNKGVYNVNISVSDGESVVYQAWSITVMNNGPDLTTPTKIELGDENEERDVVISTTFDVTNQGTQAVSNIHFRSTLSSRYDVNVTTNRNYLAPGDTMTVTVSVYIPKSQDSGRSYLGDIIIEGDSTPNNVSKSIPVYLTTRTNLLIDTTRVYVNNRRNSVDKDESVTVHPGDKIRIVVSAENIGSVDIEDVSLNVNSDELDIDEDADINKIRDGEKESLEVNFTVPYDVDEDEYPITLHVKGTDKEGADHEDEWLIYFNVQKKTHDIRIEEAIVNPEVLSCADTLSVKVTISNVGSEDEDNAAVRIIIPDLNLDKTKSNIRIDSGELSSETLTVQLNGNVSVGEHRVIVRVYYRPRTSDLTDETEASFTISSCNVNLGGGTTSVNQTVNNTNQSQSGGGEIEVVTPTISGNLVTVRSEGKSVTKSSEENLVVALLALLIVIALVSIVILVKQLTTL